MRLDEFHVLKNTLRSLETSTCLRIYAPRLSVELRKRNSPYVSHRTVSWLSSPLLEEGEGALVVFENGKRALAVFEDITGSVEGPLMASLRAEVSIPGEETPREWGKYCVPLEYVKGLIETAREYIPGLEVPNDSFVWVGFLVKPHLD